MKKISIITILLILCTTLNSLASGVYYLPDVTSEMSSYSYWTDETDVLMSYDEIEKLNKETISAKGTNMYDLKNQPEVVDGISLNEAILKSSQADAAYYLGWTYFESTEKATQADFDKIIENTQNPDAKKEQKVLYGIATKRTELRTFPSPVAIWDDPADSDLDYQYLAAVRVNEPVVITSKSNDGKFYLAKSVCCSGWISADSVAICKDREEWISAWDIKNEDALIVWGDKVFLETSIVGADRSDLMLTMGTVLELEKDINPDELIDNRAAYNNYAVWVPVRNEDGTYAKKLTLISEHKKVYEGYMPLTKANISKVVFSALGNTYGWGGSLNSDDCSGYMRNVYKCFGMELARNTTWQSSMPMAKVDMQYMAKEERIKFFAALPFGTILYFSGHEMMYLGERNGKYYVISSVGTIMQPENPTVRQRIRSTIINTLDVKRANGNTWFDELTVALVPYFDVNEKALPEYDWYHDGVVNELGLTVLAVEHRVKEERSLAGKLERKGDLYNTFEDITDILGCRVVCFLSDEIDKIGKKIEENFVVEWGQSSDKRALIQEDAFGYLSLHYICSLPFGDKWPDEICGKKFEVQIRTILQHAWAAIHHDIGYKSDFGVPREIKRQFARLACLLELADDEFVRARDNMVEYTEDIRQRIITDDADDISINMISLNEYVQRNQKMQGIIREIADIADAEIREIDPESYIPQLAFLGITKLGDIEVMIKENYDLAIKLAEKALSAAGLDIVSSSVALRFLCRAELLNKDYDFDKIVEFLKISLRTKEKAQRQAKHLLKQKGEC